MQFLRIVGVLDASSAVASFAQAASPIGNIPAVERAGFQHLRAADLKADLYFLASGPLQGRLSLQPGDEAATQWVAAEFAKAGLAPAAGNSYLQAVPLIEYRGDRETSFVKLQRTDKVTQWHAPDLIGGFHDDLEVTSSLIFAGYGITAPGLRYDDIVKALGGAGETVEKSADIGPALNRAFASGVPYLVNVLTDPADAYPRSSNLA